MCVYMCCTKCDDEKHHSVGEIIYTVVYIYILYEHKEAFYCSHNNNNPTIHFATRCTVRVSRAGPNFIMYSIYSRHCVSSFTWNNKCFFPIASSHIQIAKNILYTCLFKQIHFTCKRDMVINYMIFTN